MTDTATQPELPTEPTPEPAVVDPGVTFHDAGDVQAALAANQPTPQGAPLNPYAVDILKQTKDGLAAVEGWLNHMKGILNKIDQW